ncbi:branched-subunit amino acid transport protein AzlD [Brevibacterium sanguinis]|uniref:Branched-subunit amino acid transport protein AzlD n=2 Tax=Brevibacterium TaxID=1696 RepID=A0A366IJC6_9MICO|nr:MULTISPECIES: AzlD domain-containing protein [Brevibacterium]RBP65590.1 branched-subunit amino acid transport protein AzlD [Brevibacterium sanguinis]RBP72224.1 branched-subunit amino acid transport protein AzlD [Brevibacterium celere]
MNAVEFLIALAALSAGTYAMRFAGVKVGAAVAVRGRTRANAAPGAGGRGAAAHSAAADSIGEPDQAPGATTASDEPTSRVTRWMDRATVVLIAAVCATTALFDGQDLADPARLIGVGVGIAAAILRVPMLICVVAGMGVCALIRTTGLL